MANEPIFTTFKLPDGKGGVQPYYFTTAAYNIIMSDGRSLEEKIATLTAKVKEMWAAYLTPTPTDIKAILNNAYISIGSDGEGEKNGVPTTEEIKAILQGTYEHTDKELDEFAPDDVISVDDVKKILNGTY